MAHAQAWDLENLSSYICHWCCSVPLLCQVLWSLTFSLVQHCETSYSTRNTLSGRKQLALIHIWPLVNLPQLFQMVSRQMVLEPEAWLPERERERGSLGLGTAWATSTSHMCLEVVYAGLELQGQNLPAIGCNAVLAGCCMHAELAVVVYVFGILPSRSDWLEVWWEWGLPLLYCSEGANCRVAKKPQ